MSVLLSSRGLLVVVTVFAIVNAGAAFSCYEQGPNKDSMSEVHCSTGTCFSGEGEVNGIHVVVKGCSPRPSEAGCADGPLADSFTGHVYMCKTSLCNSAITPSVALPLLVLPAVLQYFFN